MKGTLLIGATETQTTETVTLPGDDVFEVDLVPLAPYEDIPPLDELKDLRSRSSHGKTDDRTSKQLSQLEDANGFHVILNHRLTDDGKIIVQPKVVRESSGRTTSKPGKRKVIRRIFKVPRDTPIESILGLNRESRGI